MTARKRHIATTVEETVALVERLGITSPATVAETLGCSVASARRHLDGGVLRGELVCDDYDDADGYRLTAPRWRYTVKA